MLPLLRVTVLGAHGTVSTSTPEVQRGKYTTSSEGKATVYPLFHLTS